MKRITKRFLEEHHACPERLIRFEEVFGNAAEVNYENARIWQRINCQTWRGDFIWLFCSIFGSPYKKGRRKTLLKLAKYMKIFVFSDYFDAYRQVRDDMHGMRSKRLLNAIVQIIHMV